MIDKLNLLQEFELFWWFLTDIERYYIYEEGRRKFLGEITSFLIAKNYIK